MTKYPSDVVLGEQYKDEQTGFQGTVTSITFFQYACERVCLESYDATRKEVKTEVFDAPRLTSVKTNERATAVKTGGPQPPNAQRGPAGRS